MTNTDNDRLRDWVARLLQMASEARATGGMPLQTNSPSGRRN
jgi:hypothetical protein